MNLFSSSTGKSPTHSWKISADSNGVEIRHGRRVLWKGATTGIELADGSRLHPAHPSLCENILTLDFPGELTVRHQFILAGDRLRVTTTLLNRSPLS